MATEFTIKMDTGNAAFDPDPQYEVARILREIADRLERDGANGLYQTIHDINGNDVGRWRLK